MNATNSTSNSTMMAAALIPEIGICRAVILITSFFFNSMVLSVYCIRPKLRTSFSIYIIYLLISNLLDLILFFPFMIANNLGTNENHYIFGEAGCIVYSYGIAAIRCLCLSSHALITINRIWAMTFPLSYKKVHGKRCAIALCLCAFIGVHILFLPGVVQNEQRRPRPVKKYGCWYSVRQDSPFSALGFALFYILPLVIVATYPYLFYMYLRARKRIQHGAAGAASESRASRTFGIVSLLSLCTIVCWMPEELVTILMIVVPTRGVIRSYAIVSLISSFQVLFDPIFLIVSAKDLRFNLLKIFCRKEFVNSKGETVNMATLGATRF